MPWTETVYWSMKDRMTLADLERVKGFEEGLTRTRFKQQF